MVHNCTSVHTVETSQIWLTPMSTSPGWVSATSPNPVPLGDSPRPAGRSGPGSYQIIVFVLGPSGHEILCAHFKSEVFISPSPLGLPKLNPTGLQSQMGACLPSAEPLGWGAQRGALNSLSCGRTSVISLQFVCCPPVGMGFDSIMSPPLLPISLWFHLYVFSCRFWYVLVFFIDGHLQIVVILVGSWEEVSSGSFPSALLTIPLQIFNMPSRTGQG